MVQPGEKVRIRANPGRIGVVGRETDGVGRRQRVLVTFLDGEEEFLLPGSLEKVGGASEGPRTLLSRGRYGRTHDLRGLITLYRLNGNLANLIYSLNATNTDFYAHQFKPVLKYLESPSRGLLIADEVGLGKTIEAGLVWTEIQARENARRLLVVCPAMLREKWRDELEHRFGVRAEIVDARGLLEQLTRARADRARPMALVASLQGLRPPKKWDDKDEPSGRASGKLARFLDESAWSDPLLDMVVIDEAHYLKNAETKSHRLGQLLRAVSHGMLLLSATPIQLKNEDLFNLLHLLDSESFPYLRGFERAIVTNMPLVRLRDRVLNSHVTRGKFVEAVAEARRAPLLAKNRQLAGLAENPPDDQSLQTPTLRAELAEELDVINPLSRLVVRTLKRDVQDNRVERHPVVLKITMSDAEQQFYELVTERVRAYCEASEMPEGFMMTIPQRQMASCMAAACRGWLAKGDTHDAAQLLYGAYGGEGESASNAAVVLGPLVEQLVAAARDADIIDALRGRDTKYESLRKHLGKYWTKYPKAKVVLFSFYKGTLRYLAQRLKDDGYPGVLVHGGMDKHAAIREFADPDGPHILLSSEVMAEGVDLQFASLLVNYDLPWNPAKIEQRIGRIDRIGQKQPKILIWNLVHEDTIDERVHDKLLDRLGVFKGALGSMEAVLGDEVAKMTRSLLMHRLTPAQERARIDRAAVAIETVRRDEDVLDKEAANLIAHGDFIQNQVRAARELGRYVRDLDLKHYVVDFFERHFPGSRFVCEDPETLVYSVELSADARLEFGQFLAAQSGRGSTSMLRRQTARVQFQNRKGVDQRRGNPAERIAQDHALIQFVATSLRALDRKHGYMAVSAATVRSGVDTSVPPGVYVYVVTRWSVSGARDVERLEYAGCNVSDGARLPRDDVEALVNAASTQGEDWLEASYMVHGARVADCYDGLREDLHIRFSKFVERRKLTNEDRIDQMVAVLRHHLDEAEERMNRLIDGYTRSDNQKKLRMIPVEKGRYRRVAERMESRIEELDRKRSLKTDDRFVSTGIIHVT